MNKEIIKKAADIIKKGGLVAFPTETVYGLGADALNPIAVAKIFDIKQRPRFDPIIVHIADHFDLKRLCLQVEPRVEKIIQKFWPGPLTLVLAKSSLVPDIVTAGLPTVALRMPSHPIALALIREANTPIAAPSANPFGYLSPTTCIQVIEQLGDKIDLIIDGGTCPIGIESTVISFVEKEPTVLRLGGINIEELEKVIGKIKIKSLNSKTPASPGQLPHHYSPKTPLCLLNSSKKIKVKKNAKIGLIAFSLSKENLPYAKVEVLSPSGNLKEAAANLFSCLYRLDKAGLDIIYAEPVPEIGLGRAIMDRLRRAATYYNFGGIKK